LFSKIRGIETDILEELELCHRTTYDKLANQFFVSKTTIRKAIIRLGDVYPILRFQGRGGGVELDRHRYGLPSHILNLITSYLEKLEVLYKFDENIKRCLSYLKPKFFEDTYR